MIRFVDHAIRGYASSNELGSVEQLLSSDPQHPLDSIRLTMMDTGEVKNIPISDAKAVFFVSTFDGDTHHKALHFHQHAPIQPGLWVRVRFQDEEEIEGFVSNTRDHVLGPGFFMMPTDPDGNNRLIYVMKSRLKDFNVLGIRNAIRIPAL